MVSQQAGCIDCGRKRTDGWVIVAGKCQRCGPTEHAERRAVLLAQAHKLIDAECDAALHRRKGA